MSPQEKFTLLLFKKHAMSPALGTGVVGFVVGISQIW